MLEVPSAATLTGTPVKQLGDVPIMDSVGERPERSRTEAHLDDDQQILDADGAVVVGVAGTAR